MTVLIGKAVKFEVRDEKGEWKKLDHVAVNPEPLTSITIPITDPFALKLWKDRSKQRAFLKPLGNKLRKYARRYNRSWRLRTYPMLKARRAP